MNVLVVIQARLGSTRLPGKVLLDLGGKPVLQHVVERAQRSGYRVVVAAPDNDLPRLMEAVPGGNRFGADIPEDDVLGRFADTAESFPTYNCVVRITADCPCLDPALIRQTVAAVKAGHDYAGNTVERHWPRGLDVEAFTTELLLRAHQTATDPYDREHVTPWMQRWASKPYALPAPVPDRGLERYRWCLDTPADYRWLQEAFRAFPDPTMEQVMTLPPRYD